MSRHEPSTIPGGVVTSDATYRGNFSRKLLLGSAGLVVLVGLGAGGWYAWNHTSLLHTPSGSSNTPVDYTKLSPTAAIKAAQTQVDGAHTSTEKQAAYTALGDAYSRNGQTSQGATAYQQALTYTPDDIQLLERLSSTYEDAGDNANAAKTLQKVIDALNASNVPSKDKLLSRYEAELRYVQGKGGQ